MYFSTFSNYCTNISDKESGRVERDAGLGKMIEALCIIVNVSTSCDFMGTAIQSTKIIYFENLDITSFP